MNKLFKNVSRLLPFLVIPLFAHVDVASFKSYADSLIPGVRFGMSLRSVKMGKEIGNVRGDDMFTPASTLKTLTTAAAIHYLPLNYDRKQKSLYLAILKNLRLRGLLKFAAKATRIFRRGITTTRSTC